MSIRGLVARSLLVTALLGAGVVALVGGVTLRGSGLVAIGIAGGLAGCLAAGVVRESPGAVGRSVLEAAAQAAGWTVMGLLVITGTVVLAGGVVAAVAVATAGAVALGLALVRRRRPSHDARAAGKRAGAAQTRAVVPINGSVANLSTRALGKEWTRTSMLLAGRLEPAVRVAVVHRRQQTLDELEQRDPVGFSRWLAAGPTAGSDPSEYVHGERTAGTDAA